MRRIAITGHTRGVGKMIQSILEENGGWEILGFSRNNGYDIDSAEVRRKILTESHNCDFFINNAHSQFSQTLLLSDLFTEWRELPRTIINIGVDSFTPTIWKTVYRDYAIEKVALHAAVEHYQNLPRVCRVINIALNYTDTESNSFYPGAKISKEELRACLLFTLNAPDGLEIKNLTIAPQPLK